MGEQYIVIGIGPGGYVRCLITTDPVVPEGWAQPGEIAFVVTPCDIQLGE